ncbi:MAG: hypothetical protein HY369_00850 [Candidatus Aenigmarchaeota archaeon]|nr:hypothetical protein [Candidatus Aenigmarchaeota archaeon]
MRRLGYALGLVLLFPAETAADPAFVSPPIAALEPADLVPRRCGSLTEERPRYGSCKERSFLRYGLEASDYR